MITITERENSGTVTCDAGLRTQAFRHAVNDVATIAHARLPQSLHGNLERALALVQRGAVWIEDDGTHAHVWSSHTQTWRYINGGCGCENAQYTAQDGYCKHVLSTMLYKRAVQMLHQPTPAPEVLDARAGAASPTIAPEHLCEIQGRQYVKYAGLLQMAHARGLVSLTAEWTANEPELSLAHAVATFQDGRRFEESGDAAPANVNRKVAVAFRRIALTRAKARVLRDALGCDFVALEELGETGEGTA